MVIFTMIMTIDHFQKVLPDHSLVFLSQSYHLCVPSRWKGYRQWDYGALAELGLHLLSAVEVPVDIAAIPQEGDIMPNDRN